MHVRYIINQNATAVQEVGGEKADAVLLTGPRHSLSLFAQHSAAAISTGRPPVRGERLSGC